MAKFYLYKNYPEGMKDHDIIERLREYTNVIIESGAQVNTVWQLSPLIQLGQYELEKRQTKRLTRLSVGISIVSSCVAVAALWIAVENSRASERWETAQLQILEKINQELSGELEEVLKSNPAKILAAPSEPKKDIVTKSSVAQSGPKTANQAPQSTQ